MAFDSSCGILGAFPFFDQFDSLHHGIHSHGKEFIEIEGTGRLFWANLNLFLQQDGTGVDPFISPKNG